MAAMDALGVACRHCGAEVGHICRTKAGRRSPIHSVRQRDWDRVGPQKAASAWNAANPVGMPVRLDLGPADSWSTARRTVDTVTLTEAWVRQDSLVPVVRVAHENRLVALKFVTPLAGG